MWFISFWCQDMTLQNSWREGNRVLPLSWLNFPVLSILPNLTAGMTTRPLLIHLSITRVLELQIKRCQIRQKANTPSYNFYEKPSPNSIVSRPELSRESRWWIYPVFINGWNVSPILSNPLSSSDTTIPTLYARQPFSIWSPKAVYANLINFL